MTSRRRSRSAELAASLAAATLCCAAHAGATIYTSYAAWSSAIGGTDAKIDFNIGTPGLLDEQYAWMGVHFAPGQATAANSTSAPDGWLALTTFSGGDRMIVDYDLDQWALGFDIGPSSKVTLFYQGSLVYVSPTIPSFGLSFRGLVSEHAFDWAIIERVPGPDLLAMDNLYVGTPIPAPASGAVLLAGVLCGGRRRRWTA